MTTHHFTPRGANSLATSLENRMEADIENIALFSIWLTPRE